MNRPVVSVIIPAYNCEDYLEEAVSSVLAQTFEDLELIIIDDCSTDGTAALMERLGRRDSRIRTFFNQENLGAAGTRNRGVLLSSSQWIAFLDGDDLWKPDKLEKQLALAAREPEAQLIFTGSAFIEDDGMTIGYVLHVPEKVDRARLLHQNVISCSSVLIRKRWMEKYPMPTQEGIHEDFADWLAILDELPYAYGVDEPLLIYRRALTSKSGKKGKSARMNWKTYEYAGVDGPKRVSAMAGYTLHGLVKYGRLWWKSYHLMNGKERFKRLFFLIMNLLLIGAWLGLFAYTWFRFFHFRGIIGVRYYMWGHVVLLGLYAATAIVLGKLFGAFRVVEQSPAGAILSHIYCILLLNLASYLQLALIGRWRFMQHSLPILVITGLDLLVSLAWIGAVRWLYFHIYPPNELLVIYSEEDEEGAAYLARELKKEKKRYIIGGMMSLAEGREQIEKEIARHDSVMLADIPAEDREHYLKYCFEKRKRCYCQTSFEDIMVLGSTRIHVSDMTLRLFPNCGLSIEQRLVKRVFDLVISLLLLIVLSPVILVVAILAKQGNPDSLITRQVCLSKNGKAFRRLKFRTKREVPDGLPAEEGEYTRNGRRLEATHLDEFPQLLNVLKGDMSLVGPYPVDPQTHALVCERHPEYVWRLMFKPGITSYAMVNGRYFSSRVNQLKMDLYYMENYSFFLDLSIIAATGKVVLSRQPLQQRKFARDAGEGIGAEDGTDTGSYAGTYALRDTGNDTGYDEEDE